MYVIKMESDKSLLATVQSTIYVGEKNADTMVFVIPRVHENVKVADCDVYMRYILPDGTGRSELLQMYAMPYNEEYLQYRTPVNTQFTKQAGDVEVWLTALDGYKNVVLKTGTSFVYITPSKDIADYLPKAEINQLDELSMKIADLELTKADGLVYDDDTRALQLKAGENPVGNIVTVPSENFSGGEGEDWGNMDDEDKPDFPPMDPEDPDVPVEPEDPKEDGEIEWGEM